MNQVASLICYSFLITLASAETITYKDLKDNRIGDPQETCYRFTWAGVYDAEEDEGKQCEDYFPDDICFQPLLFTKNATTCVGSGLPDIECILQECNAMNATCTCKREQSEVCVKYTKFSKDGTAVYYSSFCGSGVNQNNFGNEPVDSGCHRDKKSDIGNDREVCFCKGFKCNSSNSLRFSEYLVVVVISIFILATIEL